MVYVAQQRNIRGRYVCIHLFTGDPKQLGPIVLSKVAAGFGLDMSLLERLTLEKSGPFVRTVEPKAVSPSEGVYNPVYITKLLQVGWACTQSHACLYWHIDVSMFEP